MSPRVPKYPRVGTGVFVHSMRRPAAGRVGVRSIYSKYTVEDCVSCIPVSCPRGWLVAASRSRSVRSRHHEYVRVLACRLCCPYMRSLFLSVRTVVDLLLDVNMPVSVRVENRLGCILGSSVHERQVAGTTSCSYWGVAWQKGCFGIYVLQAAAVAAGRLMLLLAQQQLGGSLLHGHST